MLLWFLIVLVIYLGLIYLLGPHSFSVFRNQSNLVLTSFSNAVNKEPLLFSLIDGFTSLTIVKSIPFVEKRTEHSLLIYHCHYNFLTRQRTSFFVNSPIPFDIVSSFPPVFPGCPHKVGHCNSGCFSYPRLVTNASLLWGHSDYTAPLLLRWLPSLPRIHFFTVLHSIMAGRQAADSKGGNNSVRRFTGRFTTRPGKYNEFVRIHTQQGEHRGRIFAWLHGIARISLRFRGFGWTVVVCSVKELVGC